jgi:hypothetical protein
LIAELETLSQEITDNDPAGIPSPVWVQRA